MGERYYITGVQLGILKAMNKDKYCQDLLDTIGEKQFIGFIGQKEVNKSKIVIVKK